MATGQSAQPRRGTVLTDVTPGADFRTGEAEMLGTVERLANQITEAAKPGLKRRAEEIGAREGAAAAAQTAAGNPTAAPRPLLAFGDMAEARMAAAEQAFQAGIRSDFDARENEVRLEHIADPAAYQARMAQVRSTFIQNAPPEYAVDLEQYAIDRTNEGAGAVSSRAASVQLSEQAATLAGRMASLGQQMVDETAANGGPTVRYQILRNEYDSLRQARLDNPAIPYSEAEAEADDRELATLGKAAVYTNHARNVLREEGAPAALTALQDILRDPELNESERAVVFERVRTTINGEIDLATDQANMSRSAQTRAEEAMRKRIEDSAAAVEIGDDDTGLTEGEVMIVLGPSGVAEFHRKRAEAAERNRLTGSLVGLDPEEAMRRARAGLPGAAGTTLADLGEPLKDPTAFDAFAAAIRMVETGNNPARVSADPDGAGPAGGGAVGAMQLLPDTARAAARRLGIPYDENRLLNDVAYNEQLGREELRHLLTQYDGNAVLAATAYHAGTGNVNGWLQPVGTVTIVDGKRVVGKGDPRTGQVSMADWIDRIDRAGNPRSAAYPRSVSEALAGGRGAAEWRETQAEAIVNNATAGFAADPQNQAVRLRLGAPIALPVDAVFEGGAAVGQWGEAMRARQARGQELANERGVPQRILTNAEAAAYRDRFTRDPGQAVEFARQATRYLGGRGARDALAEIGRGDIAPATIHIATLAASGGSARFADNAARGLQLKAAGETLSTERAAEIAEAVNAARAPFADNPPLLQAIRATAEAAALADEVGGNGDRRSPDYYAQGALGRTQSGGHLYGGVAPVNGRQVLLPPWLNPEYVDDALEALGESWVRQDNGPVYSNDQPLPAHVIAGLRMQMQPNGRYLLTDRDGRAAYSRRGGPFTVDLETMRPFLTRRLGAAGVKSD